MAVTVHGEVAATRVREVEDFVRGHFITEQLFRAVDRAGMEIDAIVHMDEYTIDIVVPWPGGLFLVYDTT